MKTLLICPSKRPAVPHLAEFGPLATVPILGDCAVGLWIEHLAAIGAREVVIVAAEGEDKVRGVVGDGARWGVRICVIAANAELSRDEAAERYRPAGEPGWLSEPNDVVLMTHLPCCPQQPLFESYASWFSALVAWMPKALTPARVRVKEARPGIWISSRARVSKTAALVPPCWVGDQVTVEAGAIVGSGAILEDRAVVGARALVIQSWVGPDTFVGPMTSVSNSLAWGSTLTDWRTDSSLHVPDSFLLGSLARPSSAATSDRFGRALSKKDAPEPQAALVTALRAQMDRTPNLKQPG
jgi:carbonic anhydrase/acetyltransferase-like protein (isoleucine patch superfamily)